MSHSTRTRVLRVPKREQEIHLLSNPSDRLSDSNSVSSSSEIYRKTVLDDEDYQAPMTARRLRPNSNWLIVRRNLHRIRFMGYNERGRDSAVPDLYLGFQMKRELKRAQDEIKNIDKEENFHAIKHFALAVDNKRVKTYDISHVQPNDALIYDRLGEEPLSLQNLLYYFSKQEVGHGTLFWDFLNEVNRVLNMKRKRTVLVERLRRLALTLAIILYVIIGIMFILLIASVISTTTKMYDPEVQWLEPAVELYSNSLIDSSPS